MKAAAILFFLVAYFQAETRLVAARAIEFETELEPKEQECVEELGLNKEEIQTINNGDIVPEDNTDFNKFLGCYYQKMDWQDPYTGEVNWDNFRHSMDEVILGEVENEAPAVKMLVRHMMLSTVNYCQHNPPRKGNNHGQTVARVQNCVMRKLNELIEE